MAIGRTYSCRTTPLTTLKTSRGELFYPLCNTCKSRDCANPIENKSIMVLHKIETWKVYKSPRGTESMVTECEGYTI